ncbi:MAG: hypothetical protein V8Q42_01760 [Anaerovoracaceae bacterium]
MREEIHEGTAGLEKEKDILQVAPGVVAGWEELRCSGGEIYIVKIHLYLDACEQEKA